MVFAALLALKALLPEFIEFLLVEYLQRIAVVRGHQPPVHRLDLCLLVIDPQQAEVVEVGAAILVAGQLLCRPRQRLLVERLVTEVTGGSGAG